MILTRFSACFIRDGNHIDYFVTFGGYREQAKEIFDKARGTDLSGHKLSVSEASWANESFYHGSLIP